MPLQGLLVGGASAITARFTYAYVEGLAFIFSRRAAALVAAAELAAFACVAGVRLPLRVAATTLLVAGSARALHRLWLSAVHPDKCDDEAGRALKSMWEWEPPSGCDGSHSSAWHILRQLAITANKVQEDNPAVADLLARPELAAAELANRLYWFYRTSDDRPLVSEEEVAALEGGQGADGMEPVPDQLLGQLRRYRHFACLPYDYSTDGALSEKLADVGFTLVCASHTPDIGSGCPAYFLAISEEQDEAMLVVRGTFSPEDAFFDLLATGEPFDADDERRCQDVVPDGEPEREQAEERGRLAGHCHSGMGRAALFLGAKFGPVLRPLHAQGMRITLVGHSLGAGVAALLAVFLRNRGLGGERVRCWAFETPACADLQMAEGCSDVVTSVVHADDLVPRLCIRSFASLLEEVAGFDWRAAEKAAAARESESDSEAGSSVMQHLAAVLAWALSTGGGDEQGTNKQEGKQKSGREQQDGAPQEGGEQAAPLERAESQGYDKPYNAHVPGRVVLLFRQPGNRPGSLRLRTGDDKNEGESEGEGVETGVCDGLALVPCTHPAVRRMRLSSRMLSDHFVDSDEVVAALGGPGTD